MAGPGDRLSDLPDDLLLRILYFAPAKEAASTTALARRWRPLWLSSGAVNLDTRIYDRKFGARFFPAKRAAFVRDAEMALGLGAPAPADVDESQGRRRGHPPVRRLTLQVEEGKNMYSATEMWRYSYRSEDGDYTEHHLAHAVLSCPAARGVEELSVGPPYGAGRPDDNHRYCVGDYKLSIGDLPSEALRVLHIGNCKHLTLSDTDATAAVAFPRLEALRLYLCGSVSPKDLQHIIDAAPRLATLHLDSVTFRPSSFDEYTETEDGSPPSLALRARLRCPAVTALVLEDCHLRSYDRHGGIELDAPMLRRFRYKGAVEQLSLKSRAPDMARVELNLHWGRYGEDVHWGRYREDDDDDENETPRLFWRFVHSFIGARVLKLRLEHLEDIAVAASAEKNAFCNLECLELEALYHPATTSAGVAIANFLHCCPVIRVLRLNLSTVRRNSQAWCDVREPCSFDRKAGQDFDKSVSHFTSRRRRLKPAISFDVDDNEEVSDIPGLSEHSFSCLQSSLRYVSLRFRMEETLNMFGVRLAKFFAENAMLVEEIYIDNGNNRLREHINHKVGRWIANSSKRRNSTDSTGVAVLPLERTW